MRFPSGIRWSEVLTLAVAPAVAVTAAAALPVVFLDRPVEQLFGMLAAYLALVPCGIAQHRAGKLAYDPPVELTELTGLTGSALAAPPLWAYLLPEAGILLGLTGAAAVVRSPTLIASTFGLAVGMSASRRFPLPGLLRGAPGVILTEDRIGVDGRWIAWTDVDALSLTSVTALVWRGGPLPLLHIGLRHGGRPVRVRQFRAHANLVYLMDVIEYYRTHPEQREAIGRPGEQDRVRRQLHAARMSDAARPVPVQLP